MSKAKILLADDHQMMREGLRAILEREGDLTVVGEAQTGREAVEMASALAPDIVVMDVSMPVLNGMDACRQIVAERPRVRVIALSMHSDRRYILEMLRAGAAGYLLKDAAGEELLRAIDAVRGGERFLSPAIAGTVIEHLVRGEGSPTGERLSPREREVLQLLAEGRTSKEIGTELHCSARTVETHRREIMRKLDIHSVAELTKYAVREGLTPLEP